MNQNDSAIKVPLYQRSGSWPLETTTGYLIARVDGMHLLIDTGSPVTISGTGIEIGTRIQPSRRIYSTFTLDNVRKGLDARVDALIGMDMLGYFDVRFNMPASRIELHETQVPLQVTALEITPCSTLPGLSVNFLHAPETRMIFDTGAPISYIRRDLISDFEVIAESEDFYPMFGTFTTPVYRLPYTVKGNNCTGEFGVLPELLEAGLLAQNIDGIIGSQLITNNVAVLATRRQRLDITFDSKY